MAVGLSKELASKGTRVDAVRPGIVNTDIHTSGGPPHRIDRLEDAVPMDRVGLPEEVAPAIVCVCSDEASYVTGALLDKAGGR